MLYSASLEGFYRVRVNEGESDHYGSWNSIIREKGLAVSVSVCVGVLFFSSSGDKTPSSIPGTFM